MEISNKQISLFTEDESSSSLAGFRANLTRQQVSDLEKKMTATSSQKCLEQFGRFSHVSSWAKMFSGLLIGMEGWYSTKCRLTWKLKGTKSNRLYFQLVPSMLPTEETECGLLLTPTTVMTDEPPEKMRERVKKNGYKNGTKFGSLLSQVKYSGMLPTPTANCHKGGAVRTDPKRQSDTLAHHFTETPGKTSQLNPRFVAEMMGFPANWTELPFLSGETNQSKPTETP